MRSKSPLAAIALVLVLFLGSTTAFASTNLIHNGSFETGDFTGWTAGGFFDPTYVVSGRFYVYSGAEDGLFYVALGSDLGDGTLSQTLATTPGAQYTFSFWFAAVQDRPSEFFAGWDSELIHLYYPDTRAAWTQFSFPVTGTGSDVVWFGFYDDPAFMALDNVSATPVVTGTPEPGTLLLLGSSLFLVGGIIRRRPK